MSARRPLLAAAVAAAALLGAACGPDDAAVPVVEARQAPFEKILTVTGRLAAKETLTLAAPTQGKLASIVSEGTVVKAGDVVFALDTQQIEEGLDNARIDATVSESALRKAQEEIRSDVVRTELSLRETTAQLEHARLELERAERDLEKKKRQVQNQILPAAEIPAAELQLEQARLGVSNAEIALERLTEEAATRRQTLELDRLTAQARAERSRAQVAEAEEFLAKAQVTAPRDGVVVHVRTWRGETLKAGDDVWQRQPVVELPDLAEMEVQLQIHEADISNVRDGLPARVRVEAWPDLVLTARVADVSGVAKELRDREGKNTGVRAFDATLALDAQDARLRPGMTARVELVAESRPSALVLPVAAVRRDGDKAFVTLASGEEREVVVDASSSDVAVIASGLAAGDRVRVVPRAAAPAENGAAEAAPAGAAPPPAPGGPAGAGP